MNVIISEEVMEDAITAVIDDVCRTTDKRGDRIRIGSTKAWFHSPIIDEDISRLVKGIKRVEQ